MIKSPLLSPSPGESTICKIERPVKLWGLVSLIFFSVSGGPFGSEGSVSAAGPFWAILGFSIFPFLWCIPQALITSELSSVFPGNAGFSAWVCAAFGPHVGFIEGWIAWVSGVTSTAIYPHLFLEYAKAFFPSLGEGIGRGFFLVGFPGIMSYINYRGLDLVSKVGFVLMVVVLGPFVVMSVLGWGKIDSGNFWIGYEHWPSFEEGAEGREPGALVLFSILFWNLSSWDYTSTISGEVVNARRVIPRAFFFGFVITTLGYIIPLLVGVGITRSEGNKPLTIGDFSDWSAGHYQQVAREVGGSFLSGWVLLAASVAIVGQFQALISSNSYSIQAQAQLGWLPKVFATSSQYDTPTVGIVITVCAALLMTSLDFMSILQMLNCVYCLAQILEFSAFLTLRSRYPDLSRPFRVPFGLLGCALLCIAPFAFLVLIFILPVLAGKSLVLVYLAGVFAVGNLLYAIFELGRRWRLFSYVRAPPLTAYELVAIYKTPAPPLRVGQGEARPFSLGY